MSTPATVGPAVNITVEWGPAAAATTPGSYIGWASKLPGVLPFGFEATTGPEIGGVRTVMKGPAAGATPTPPVALGQAPAYMYLLFALFGATTGDKPAWTFPPQAVINDVTAAAAACNVSGDWRFANWPKQQEMTFIEDSYGNFSFASHNPGTPWRTATGHIDTATNKITIQYGCDAAGCFQEGSINQTRDKLTTGDGTFSRGSPHCHLRHLLRRRFHPRILS